MRRLSAAILALSLLGGCATFQRLDTAWTAVKSATVSPEGVIVSAKIFDAVEATATNYLKLKRCNGTNGPICRDPAVTKTIITAVRQGREARNSLIAFQRAHPGQLGDQGVYDALQTSIDTLTGIVNAYIGAKS